MRFVVTKIFVLEINQQRSKMALMVSHEDYAWLVIFGRFFCVIFPLEWFFAADFLWLQDSVPQNNLLFSSSSSCRQLRKQIFDKSPVPYHFAQNMMINNLISTMIAKIDSCGNFSLHCGSFENRKGKRGKGTAGSGLLPVNTCSLSGRVSGSNLSKVPIARRSLVWVVNGPSFVFWGPLLTQVFQFFLLCADFCIDSKRPLHIAIPLKNLVSNYSCNWQA